MPVLGIVLVDDHPAVREGLRGLFEAEAGIEILAAAASAAEGFEAIRSLRPGAAVIDHNLPDENGLRLCLRLQELADPPRAVVYSAFADARLRVLGAVAGAAAVIPKSAPPDDVLVAVRGDDPTPQGGGQHSARALREVGSGLGAGDLAILGMLCHGVAPPDIAATLSIDEPRLAARRRAMFDRLSAPARRPPVAAAGPPLASVAG